MGEWISVSDKIPPKNGEEFIGTDGKIVEKMRWIERSPYLKPDIKGWFCVSSSICCCCSGSCSLDLTHWQPLPELPNE